MADQASMTINGPSAATARMGAASSAAGGPSGGGGGDAAGPGDVVSSVAELGSDLLSLAELQARLAAIEVKQNVQAVQFGGAVALVGAVLGIAGLPIALGGIAGLLVTYLGLGWGWALILVAVGTFAIAGACLGIAVARLRAADIGFPMSREEFARNINWVRTVILYSGRAARNRRR